MVKTNALISACYVFLRTARGWSIGNDDVGLSLHVFGSEQNKGDTAHGKSGR
jgi:hypothetical protein